MTSNQKRVLHHCSQKNKSLCKSVTPTITYLKNRNHTYKQSTHGDPQTSTKKISFKMEISFWFGRSPGLVVTGDNSCLRGHGFEFRHCTLDGHDIDWHWFVVKIVLFVEKSENKQKEARVGPFQKLSFQFRKNSVQRKCQIQVCTKVLQKW